MRGRLVILVASLLAFSGAPRPQELTTDAGARAAAFAPGPLLLPTAHPPVPTHLSQFWFGPLEEGSPSDSASSSSALSRFAVGVRRYAEKKYAEVLPLVRPEALAGTGLADYGLYYTGLAQLGLEQYGAARATFAALRARGPEGYLAEAAILREGEAAEGQKEFAAAAALYGLLESRGTTAPDDVLFRLGRAAASAGDRARAVEAYRSLYFRFPLSAFASSVETELARLGDVQPAGEPRALFELNLDRAERLFTARQFSPARAAYGALRRHATGDERALIAIRIGACDFHLKRYAGALTSLEPYLQGPRAAEAQFFYLSAVRELGRAGEFVSRTRRLVERFPDSPWTEEALNNLATHYIRVDDEPQVMAAFRDLLARFPGGTRAERAGWKLGWWLYEKGDLADAIAVFEQAAAAFPRGDTRPAFLYWAGRAHEKLGHQALAMARYRLVRADYLNSYYGRLADTRLDALGPFDAQPVAAGVVPAVAPAAVVGLLARSTFGVDLATGVPTESHQDVPGFAGLPDLAAIATEKLIRQLLSLELFDDAANELTYLGRTLGESPAIQATMAWIHNRRGELRRGINAMKRAYPQYIAMGGETLPEPILKVLFPLDYWDLIRRHSEANGVDPFLMAALVAQESTFMPAVRSPANAYGLMQVLPSTGRQLARALQLGPFSTRMLTTPEINVRMGTRYFADLSRRLGGTHLALASYNAGSSRVARWLAQKPDLDQDEFVDAIPFPETQNYVKKVLGTAEDYRRLYGDSRVTPDAGRAAAVQAAPPAAGAAAVRKPAPRPATQKPAARKPAPRKPAATTKK